MIKKTISNNSSMKYILLESALQYHNVHIFHCKYEFCIKMNFNILKGNSPFLGSRMAPVSIIYYSRFNIYIIYYKHHFRS